MDALVGDHFESQEKVLIKKKGGGGEGGGAVFTYRNGDASIYSLILFLLMIYNKMMVLGLLQWILNQWVWLFLCWFCAWWFKVHPQLPFWYIPVDIYMLSIAYHPISILFFFLQVCCLGSHSGWWLMKVYFAWRHYSIRAHSRSPRGSVSWCWCCSDWATPATSADCVPIWTFWLKLTPVQVTALFWPAK